MLIGAILVKLGDVQGVVRIIVCDQSEASADKDLTGMKVSATLIGNFFWRRR
jgi:hypothetical protein